MFVGDLFWHVVSVTESDGSVDVGALFSQEDACDATIADFKATFHEEAEALKADC